MDQYTQFDVVYLCKKSKLNICPFYLMECGLLNNKKRNETLSALELEDFISNYYTSDLTMFSFLKKHSHMLNDINNMTKEDFLSRKMFFKAFIYKRRF